MPLQYGYLIGDLILLAVWLVFFFYRKDLRKEIIFGSFLATPFIFSEWTMVPEYWNPPSLFNLIEKFGIGIESFMFAFCVGGLASVAYEVIENKKLVKIRSDRKIHILTYLVFAVAYIGLDIIFPSKTIYNMIAGFLISATVAWFVRKDLRKQILFGALFFGILYFALFAFFNWVYPNYVSTIYTLKNFIGVNLLKVPIEEILLGIGLGAAWSTFYEFIKGYRTRKAI